MLTLSQRSNTGQQTRVAVFHHLNNHRGPSSIKTEETFEHTTVRPALKRRREELLPEERSRRIESRRIIIASSAKGLIGWRTVRSSRNSQ
jgi:hypothetical protein